MGKAWALGRKVRELRFLKTKCREHFKGDWIDQLCQMLLIVQVKWALRIRRRGKLPDWCSYINSKAWDLVPKCRNQPYREARIFPVETGRSTESVGRGTDQPADGVRAGSSIPDHSGSSERRDHQLDTMMRMSEQREECMKHEGGQTGDIRLKSTQTLPQGVSLIVPKTCTENKITFSQSVWGLKFHAARMVLCVSDFTYTEIRCPVINCISYSICQEIICLLKEIHHIILKS